MCEQSVHCGLKWFNFVNYWKISLLIELKKNYNEMSVKMFSVTFKSNIFQYFILVLHEVVLF